MPLWKKFLDDKFFKYIWSELVSFLEWLTRIRTGELGLYSSNNHMEPANSEAKEITRKIKYCGSVRIQKFANQVEYCYLRKTTLEYRSECLFSFRWKVKYKGCLESCRQKLRRNWHRGVILQHENTRPRITKMTELTKRDRKYFHV